MGRVISKGKVQPDPEKVTAIREFKKPENIKEIRAFLGLLNFCREFIPGLSTKAAPLFKYLEGEVKRSTKTISWNEEATKAFNTLKNEIKEETLRYQPNMEKPFILTTDASDYAIGGILSQKDTEGKERIVHTYSKSLVRAEKNYSTTDKELLAIIKCLEHFRKYLLGGKFILKTDHRALTYTAFQIWLKM